MKSNLLVAMALAVTILSAPNLGLAHHGTNLYDMTHAVVLKGTVTQFEWGNPHNQIYFDVKDDKGGIAHWVASTEPPSIMSEKGWSRHSLNPGDEVTVYIFAAKNGAPVGNVQKIVLADGKELVAAGAPPASDKPSEK